MSIWSVLDKKRSLPSLVIKGQEAEQTPDENKRKIPVLRALKWKEKWNTISFCGLFLPNYPNGILSHPPIKGMFPLMSSMSLEGITEGTRKPSLWVDLGFQAW